MDVEEKPVSSVCDKEFKEALLSELNKLRKESILCDVALRIEGQDFPAHRCVLSAVSPYFRSLFTSGFKENESKVVELPEIQSAAVANEAFRFIYTGETLVNVSYAQDLVKIADYLIIPSLKTKMSEYLKNSINAENCLALESFAAQFDCEELEEAATAFKLQNFVSVVRSYGFKMLDFEKVKELVSHDEIVVSKEEDVYEGVIAWVKHDILTRESLFPELLRRLRLFSVSKYSLRNILKEELVSKSRTCTSIVHEGMDFVLFPDTFLSTPRKSRSCLNSDETAIILTGGHGTSGAQNQIPTSDAHGLLLSRNHWFALPTMPLCRTRHGAVVCCGQLYVFGGKSSNPMCSFNPKQNKWICTDDELPSRLHCSVTAFNEELYVTGGENHWNRVDKYNPTLDEWRLVASMKTGRAAHCTVTMQNLIFFIGGCNHSVCHNSVECFDPLNNQWTDKPNMSRTRKFAAAATSNGKVFVVGGYKDMRFKTLNESCEMLDPMVDEWSLIASPIVPRAACALVSFDHDLYLFGGECREDATDGSYSLDSVERYDVENDKWEQFGTMPTKLSCVQASVLQLPTKFIAWPIVDDE